MDVAAYIALGSNLGDRELNLLRAVAEIGKIPDSRITGLSPFYESSPVGLTDQPHFYNAVLKLVTALSPHSLLEQLQHIETALFNRTRDIHWGPRTMDLDLLLHGDALLSDDILTLPHPRMGDRLFVLRPLHDIAPGLVLPGSGQTVEELLDALSTDDVVTKL